VSLEFALIHVRDGHRVIESNKCIKLGAAQVDVLSILDDCTGKP
jgi:hypothetical protein